MPRGRKSNVPDATEQAAEARIREASGSVAGGAVPDRESAVFGGYAETAGTNPSGARGGGTPGGATGQEDEGRSLGDSE